MTSKTTTIHIIDQPNGGIMVYTTAGSPLPGQRLTPGQALATDLLNVCTHRASDVRYWHGKDRALEFVESCLNPEGNGYAVSAYVRDQARHVLGMPQVETPQVPA
jgi:hypothetical protein